MAHANAAATTAGSNVMISKFNFTNVQLRFHKAISPVIRQPN